MRIIVGLGNPGSEYDGTRHNAGFAVTSAVAAAIGARFRTGRWERIAVGRIHGREIVVVQPLTWMNNSGTAVAALLRETGTEPDGLLVCCDDLHLPLGELRLRKQGGDGGHNGLRSVIRELGAREFPRLRCGIRGATAPGPGEDTAAYVLSPFLREEEPEAAAMTGRAAEAVLTAVRRGIDLAMNDVNVKRS